MASIHSLRTLALSSLTQPGLPKSVEKEHKRIQGHEKVVLLTRAIEKGVRGHLPSSNISHSSDGFTIQRKNLRCLKLFQEALNPELDAVDLACSLSDINYKGSSHLLKILFKQWDSLVKKYILMVAIQLKDPDVVNFIKNPDVRVHLLDILKFAVLHGHIEAVRTILNMDIAITQPYEESIKESFIIAAKLGHLPIVRVLEDNLAINQECFETAFIHAAELGKAEVCERLRSNPLCTREIIFGGFIAAAEQGQIGVLSSLMGSGLNLTTYEEAFLGAAENNQLQTIIYLSRFGLAKPRVLNAAFIRAAQFGHKGILEYLKHLPSAVTEEAVQEAFNIAAIYGHEHVLKYLFSLNGVFLETVGKAFYNAAQSNESGILALLMSTCLSNPLEAEELEDVKTLISRSFEISLTTLSFKSTEYLATLSYLDDRLITDSYLFAIQCAENKKDYSEEERGEFSKQADAVAFGIFPDRFIERRKIALRQACQTGHLSTLPSLMHHPAIDKKFKAECLAVAVEASQKQVIELLVKSEVLPLNGHLALMQAVRKYDKETAKDLLQQTSIDRESLIEAIDWVTSSENARQYPCFNGQALLTVLKARLEKLPVKRKLTDSFEHKQKTARLSLSSDKLTHRE